MLKNKDTSSFKRKKSELKGAEGEFAAKLASEVASQTAGEIVRDATLKAAKEATFEAGNNTDKLAALAQKLGEVVDKVTEKADNIIQGGVALIGGGEASKAAGNIAFKTAKDISRGDKVCTGLYLVSATCETVELGCSTIKIIPFRGKIYIGAKIVSKGCMAYRNACAGEGC